MPHHKVHIRRHQLVGAARKDGAGGGPQAAVAEHVVPGCGEQGKHGRVGTLMQSLACAAAQAGWVPVIVYAGATPAGAGSWRPTAGRSASCTCHIEPPNEAQTWALRPLTCAGSWHSEAGRSDWGTHGEAWRRPCRALCCHPASQPAAPGQHGSAVRHQHRGR